MGERFMRKSFGLQDVFKSGCGLRISEESNGVCVRKLKYKSI